MRVYVYDRDVIVAVYDNQASAEAMLCTHVEDPRVECEVFMALCEGRHEIPEAVDGAIFPQEIVDPTDVQGLEEHALEALFPFMRERLNLYVTGLSVALIAALNACAELDIRVTCWHYDRESGAYYLQEVKGK